MNKIIYFSRLLPVQNKGGGCRRLLQIHDFLKKIDPQVELVHPWRSDLILPEKMKKVNTKNQGKFFQSFPFPGIFINNINKWSNNHQGMIYRLRKASKILLHTVSDLEKFDLAVMDDPIYFMPLFKKLIQCRIPVIAICHNIESLVPGQVKKDYSNDLFRKELELLSQCRLVITISREEDVILRNFGITSWFVPYYPVEPIRKRLLAIRDNRKNNPKNDILMIGTSKNSPTREGMKSAARYWMQHHLEQIAGKLIIGGFQAETFLDCESVPGVMEFRGTLSNDDLDQLMEKVNACLCYQEKGAGALTRICETLIAGVPVLANTHAARSYYNMKGVYEFRVLGELAEALKQIDEIDASDGDIPLPPAPDFSSLEVEVKKIMK